MTQQFCGVTYQLMQRMLIPVARENRITWFEGIPYADRKTDFAVRGIIFPLTGKELLLVPEGDRFRQNIWVYTQEDIRDDDVIIHNDQPYEMQTVQNWGTFKQGRAMRFDVGPLGNQ